MDNGGGCGLWVAVEVAGVLGLLIVLQNLQIIGLWFFFFFFCSGMYYFIVVDILFYYNVYIILLC